MNASYSYWENRFLGFKANVTETTSISLPGGSLLARARDVLLQRGLREINYEGSLLNVRDLEDIENLLGGFNIGDNGVCSDERTLKETVAKGATRHLDCAAEAKLASALGIPAAELVARLGPGGLQNMVDINRHNTDTILTSFVTPEFPGLAPLDMYTYSQLMHSQPGIFNINIPVSQKMMFNGEMGSADNAAAIKLLQITGSIAGHVMESPENYSRRSIETNGVGIFYEQGFLGVKSAKALTELLVDTLSQKLNTGNIKVTALPYYRGTGGEMFLKPN